MARKLLLIVNPYTFQNNILNYSINMYCALCETISLELHNRYEQDHIKFNCWILDETNKSSHLNIYNKFPFINKNFLESAFFRVANDYNNNKLDEYYNYINIFDCNNRTTSIKSIYPSPCNDGMLRMSTLTGPQTMPFSFDDTNRRELEVAFNSQVFREFELILYHGVFCLTTYFYEKNEIDLSNGYIYLSDESISKITEQNYNNTIYRDSDTNQ